MISEELKQPKSADKITALKNSENTKQENAKEIYLKFRKLRKIYAQDPETAN